MLSLLRSFRFTDTPKVAFVGAGGKTTAMFSLAHQIHSPTLVTATTHMGSWEVHLADKTIITNVTDSDQVLYPDALHGVTLLIGPETENNRHLGLTDERILEIIEKLGWGKYPVLIESDGSKKRPLKAPADHEPAIPEFADTVVVVAGMYALGHPLSENIVHRVEQFSRLSGTPMGEKISPNSIIKVLGHQFGGLKNMPPKARKILLLNQADTIDQEAAAKDIAKQLLSSYERVIVSSLSPNGNPARDIKRLKSPGQISLDMPIVRRSNQEQIISTHEHIVGIILAAGEARRFGSPKQLVEWDGEPLIRHVVKIALESALSEVMVVTGAYADEVSNVIEDLPVINIHNSDWREGQSSSIRMGVENIDEYINAAIFILADQPFIDSDLIKALVACHNTSLAPIIAPIVNKQRGNPVLFDRTTFSDLKKLTGNQGGREIFDRYEISYVEWEDQKILADIDTFEDYLRLEKS